MSQLSLPTTIAFLLYVIIVLAIGIYAYSKTKDATDYFLGGRKLSPLVAAIFTVPSSSISMVVPVSSVS